MKSWYAVFCKPRQEERAFTHLQRQGYTSYLPRLICRARRRGQPIPSIQPLFPRYLFIRLDAIHENWGPVRSTCGVGALVRFGGQPAVVPEVVIASLQARENPDGLHELATPEFCRGDRVRVTSGAMRNLEGVFLERSGAERVMILLDLLGQQSRVELAEDLVEVCRQPALGAVGGW